MSSRAKILAAVKANQPEKTVLPDLGMFEAATGGSLEKFAAILQAVGGKISYVSGYAEIIRSILAQHGTEVRIVSPIPGLRELSRENLHDVEFVHDLADVEVAVLHAHFGVAENGAIWLTEKEMQHRVLPFITQHLAVVLEEDQIVWNMHQAYEAISKTTYGFGTFIAGPSKTADIEQSLVIGAHGPRSMTVFIKFHE